MIQFLPPKLEILSRISVLEVDRVLMKKLHAVMWKPFSISHMLKQIESGQLEAYATPEGLVLLETIDWPGSRELRVVGMVGRGIITQGKQVVSDLKKIAAHKGCSIIGGEGIPRGWKKAAPRLGFKPVSTHYVMEL